MTAPRVESLRELLHVADEAGIGELLLRRAARELVELIDYAALADARRLETFERGRRIRRLIDLGLDRAVIRQRLGISRPAYYRALAAFRDSRNNSAVEVLQAEKETAA
jgi:hypothetical protein